jgi:DNA-binding transcriptional MerR regulator
VRNYEQDGVIPPARRSETGYRQYTPRHAAALTAYLALVRAHGYATAREIMRAVLAGDLSAAFQDVDLSHDQLRRDRDTLQAVEAALAHLPSPRTPTASPLPVGAVAHRLGVRPATLRKWQRAGILAPERDRAG